MFRIQRNSTSAFQAYIEGEGDEIITTITPGPDARRKLARRCPGERFDPVRMRLVRHTTDSDEYHLATTLLDAGHVSAKDLADLYHGRWSIEELYKVSKQTIAMDEFHGRTERGIRQELYAHFNLIAITRLFSRPDDDLLAKAGEEGCERQVSLAGCWFGACTPPTGLPVLPPNPSSMRAIVITPAKPVGAFVARFPSGDSLPRITGGSASTLPFSRPAQRALA